ncbi:uncharacterized protein LOC110023252 [Phalaenopsis equestris]|uniref:uncharacterized protein LOC110023252 n=1 Tax=Phalaenopsis equestris TaxID=78828 RepID=UPI0009E33F42|nr:uncharacterized protein LOC110023252 [Phalaenopsis equestris]
MNPHGGETSFCYFHPKSSLVGVCALCLKERLLSLAAKQAHVLLPQNPNKIMRQLRRKPSIALPKVFALGSFFHLFEARPQKPEEEDKEGSVASSLEDSFISIRFEADGRGSWESMKKSREGWPWLPSGRGGDELQEYINGRRNSVVEKSTRQRGLRWRKRIGEFIQLARWNRSRKAGASHAVIVRKVERGRGRRGWIRSLTRRTVVSTTD